MKIKIKNAILSLSNKLNLRPLLKCLKKNKINVISSGGTAKIIRSLKFKSIEISSYTGFNEILDGRVKTLHPKIHAGILSVRDKKGHIDDMKKNNFKEIDLVIVNFYPFEKKLNEGKQFNSLIESIDIGGPSMVRAAAKNFRYVAVITDPNDYKKLINEIEKNKGATTLKFRSYLATKAFQETSFYEANISNWLNEANNIKNPNKKTINIKFKEKLRYGENPHQTGSIYTTANNKGFEKIYGKNLSYNNYNDIYATLRILSSFPKNIGSAIIKHTNPCGASVEKDPLKSFQKSIDCDPKSAFGGIVGINSKLSERLAKKISKKFFEVIIFKGISKKGFNILKKKKNLILIDFSNFSFKKKLHLTDLNNFMMLQDNDELIINQKNFKFITKKKPKQKQIATLKFAFNMCKFVKSNAIVIAKDKSLIGIGAGQPSRLDSCKIAIEKANTYSYNQINGAVAASDAFFPFPDAVETLSGFGIDTIIQPGGSIRDKEVVKVANELGVSMIFTGSRHFKH